MVNEDLWKIVDKLKVDYTSNWYDLNYIQIPVTVINAEIGNEELFNEIYQWLLKSDFTKIDRTKSKSISKQKNSKLEMLDAYDVQFGNFCCELTIATVERSCRIQFRIDNYKVDGEEDFISGKQSLNIFLKELKKDNIDLKTYAIENGKEINETIIKPDIRLIDEKAVHPFYPALNKIYNANHIDFHKFYMSGLKMAHPEFGPAIDRMAEKAKTGNAKTRAKYKTAMAATIGFMHSKFCGYKYAHLAKAAIETAYERYYQVFNDLQKCRHILSTNTDGIWYEGEIYHNTDLYEGPGLTEWSNDHTNCKIRYKSRGAYEFIENENYFPVVRGRTKLDTLIPRSEWEWGDIFLETAQVEYWTFIEGVGIIWKQN